MLKALARVDAHVHNDPASVMKQIARLPLLALLAILLAPSPAAAQCRVDLDKYNRKLAGRVVDFTSNHGRENAIPSAILGCRRDLYVYLPPGYDRSKAYPLILFFHGATKNECAFLEMARLDFLDDLICRGCCPPAIVAGPDGTYEGNRAVLGTHSFFINGRGGRFEDHILQELLPFLLENFSIRPEPQAHALIGHSAGGYGAMGMAIKHRDYFHFVATAAGAINLRYSNCSGRHFDNFCPANYRWRTHYDPKEVLGIFFGVAKVRPKGIIEPVFGPACEVIENIERSNPADLLFQFDVKPGELDIYLNCPREDNFNFDAVNQSFVWLAKGKGIDIPLELEPHAKHLPPYYRRAQEKIYPWLATRLLPPIDLAQENAPSKPEP